MNKPHRDSRTILAIVFLILVVAGASSLARADSEVALMNRVNATLRTNDRLNGAKAYTAAEGVVGQVVHGPNNDAAVATLDRALAQDNANCAATRFSRKCSTEERAQ